MIPDFSTGVAWLGGVLVQLAETVPGRQESVVDMVVGAGPVVRAVLLLLGALSGGCLGITLAKSGEMRRARRESGSFLHSFRDAKNLATIQTASMDLKE